MRNEELVFGVAGSQAVAARPITLAEAGLYERWVSRSGPEADRLDILGLASDGRLVVAELKRDTAPDFVTLQAIKYAAMASRFELDQLAQVYLDFHSGDEDAPATQDEALAVLSTHATGLSTETIQKPRIQIIAGDFPTTLTSSVVWLAEQGVDLTLTRVQAYELEHRHLVTVSQVWPTPDAEEFVIGPSRAERVGKPVSTFPEVEWSDDDLRRLVEVVSSETIITTMDLCAQAPGEWIGGDQVMEATGRQTMAHRGDFGGFAITLRRKFERSNPPYEMNYGVHDVDQQYYRLDAGRAAAWRAIRGVPETDSVPGESSPTF